MTDSHEVERLSDDDEELIARLLSGSCLAWMGSLPADVYCPIMGQAGRRIRELLNDINRKPTPEGK